MIGTITWLEATEENVREIPLRDDDKIFNRTIEVLFRADDGDYYNGGYSKDFKQVIGRGFKLSLGCFTHFAYINEPE